VNGWLFDTSVLSAFAPGRPTLPANIGLWVENRSDELFLSTVAVMEVGAGVAKLRRTGAARRANILETWLGNILDLYRERILPFDLAAAHIAGELHDVAILIGRHPGLADIAIAAIAKSRGLVVLTVNHRHFNPLDIETLNPLEL
jgi:predicted nucleic acid-binding protein